MSSAPESVVKELGKKFEKTPGFGYVTVIVSAVLAIFLESRNHQASDWSLGLYSLAIALVAYWCGGFLDDILFEPFYGLPREKDDIPNAFGRLLPSWFIEPIRRVLIRSDLAVAMAKARQAAAGNFHARNQKRIYETAKKLLSKTDAWEGLIKLNLDLSKAVRTLIIPSILLFVWELADALRGTEGSRFLAQHQATAWLSHPVGSGLVAIVSIVLYVNLRLRHMRLLYQKLASAPTFSFQIEAKWITDDADAGKVHGSETMETILSVGDTVIAQNQIPVCRVRANKPSKPADDGVATALTRQ